MNRTSRCPPTLQGQHYVSVDETDVLSVVERLEGSRQSELMAITDRAQRFAYRCVRGEGQGVTPDQRGR